MNSTDMTFWMPDNVKKVMSDYKWHALEYNPEYLDQYLKLLDSEYGKDDFFFTREFLKWEYEDNPAGSVNMWLAGIENKIAGAYSVIPIRFLIQGQPIQGALSINTLTNKAHRGKKIFTTLAEITYQNGHISRGIKLILGFPNQNSLPGFVKHLKFYVIGYLHLLIFIDKPGNILKKKFKIFPAFIINKLGKIFFRKKKCTAQKKIRIENTSLFDDRFDEFWERNKDFKENMIVRDAEYLNWRYINHPAHMYKIYTAVDDKNKVIGYIVCRTGDVQGIKVGYIGDILTEKKNFEVADLLIKKAVDFLSSSDAELFGALMFNHIPYYQEFKNNGFIKCPKIIEPQPFPVIIRLMDPLKNKGLVDKEKWYLTMGDYDVF